MSQSSSSKFVASPKLLTDQERLVRARLAYLVIVAVGVTFLVGGYMEEQSLRTQAAFELQEREIWVRTYQAELHAHEAELQPTAQGKWNIQTENAANKRLEHEYRTSRCSVVMAVGAGLLAIGVGALVITRRSRSSATRNELSEPSGIRAEQNAAADRPRD